jgi:PAS domain S-box-containing protein/putative nucleotidyltransferase with HDIG domain
MDMDRYRALFKHLPSPAVLLDDNDQIDDVNQAALNALPTTHFERTLSRWLAKDLLDFRESPDSTRVIEKTFRTSVTTPKFFKVRMAKTSPGIAKSGAVLILTDITERRRTLEELGRLASIVDSTDDAIYSVSLAGKIMTWNKGAEKIYGYPADEILGRQFMLLVPGGLRDAAREVLLRASQGLALSRHETVHRHLDGHLFPVSATFSPFECYDAVLGVSVIARDISSRKQTEEELRSSHTRLQSLLHETVKSLSATHEKRDLYTAGHQQRVTRLAIRMAEHLGLENGQLEGLRYAALLHDIGKVCIPMAILAKPARLADEEMGMMKKHPEAGNEIVRNIPFPWPVGEIIRQHHERMDGSGYPRGMSGNDILPAARILAVADTLEAMSSHRPYRPALGLKVTLEEFRSKSGITYDPDVCDALFDLVKSGTIRWRKGVLQCP